MPLSRLLLAYALLGAGAAAVSAAETLSAGTAAVSASETAEQILASNCLECHGDKKRSGKLDLRTLESATRGGKRGAAIVPGNAAESRLLTVVQPDAKPHMPPKKQLSPMQLKTLAAWIDGLAPDDTTGEPIVPIAADAWAPPANMSPETVIDFLLESKQAEKELSPHPICEDATFLRRLSLDVWGRIPTPAEQTAFAHETASDKRTQWIDRYLQAPEFAEHFASAFDVMFMGRDEEARERRQQHGWVAYLKDVFSQNRPWNEVAREILLARGSTAERGHLWFLYERKDKHQAIAEAVSRSFFGVDIACAQCHDHPLADEIHQAHYWGLVAFFQRSKNANSPRGIALAESAIGGFDEFANALSGDTEPARLTFLQVDPVPEARPGEGEKQEDTDVLYRTIEDEPRVPVFSRREKFVDEVLANHPLLAKAMVNRLWALLMGRGLVHPLDAIDSQHPPSHPELLAWLADDFSAHNYDTKRVLRAILRSRGYQRASRPSQTSEPSLFARGLEKPLSAEAYLRSLAVLLEIPETDVNEQVGSEFRLRFPEVGNTTELTNLKQTVALSNYPPLQQLFKQASDELLARTEDSGTDAERLNAQFQRAYSRAPDEEEQDTMLAYLTARSARPAEAWSHILWAVGTSAEFRFNH